MSEPNTRTDTTTEINVLQAARSWLDGKDPVVLATVIDTWGSAPVPVGGQMAVAADGRFQGSVSGGCIEGEVIVEAEEIIKTGKPKTLTFGVADETAWRAGLPCGGEVKVYLERFDQQGVPFIDKALEARERRHGLIVKTRLEDGSKQLFERGGDVPADIADRFRSGKSELIEDEDGEVFVQALVPPARIVVIGATHIAQVLAQLAALTGYELQVIDPRTAFASPERFEGVKLHTEWPQDIIPKIGLDPFTAIVCLSHVGHIDDEALKISLRSGCLYIGALGSKRNHAKRTERLLKAGFTQEEINRISCPIGIDIGAQTPAEIAVSVMSEIILAVRGSKRKG
jgi:xanthine dehydrogenase accessory factor